MAQDDIPGRVGCLRERGYTPREIARSLGISPSEASRLVRAEAIRRRDSGRAHGEGIRCFVSPGWHDGLRVRGHQEWLVSDRTLRAPQGAGGIAIVLVAAPCGHRRVEMCSFLVDTWCLGVKDAVGPKRMSAPELEGHRRTCFAP